MRIRLCIVLAVVAFTQAYGDGQSIQPFYTSKDVLFKTELLGRWTIDRDTTLEFRDVGQNAYGITLFGDGEVEFHFRAHLFRIGRRYFLDAQVSGLDFPMKAQVEGNEEGQEKLGEKFSLDKGDVFLNRHHGLIFIEFVSDKDEFTGHLWQDDYLPTLAKSKKLKCPYLLDEMGRVLLTGNSSQLRTFVEKLPADAFDNGSGEATLTREQAHAREAK